jgi:CRISPR-associated protein Cas1
MVVWCGEEAVRFYAQGMGETRSSHSLLRQAWLCVDPARRLAVVRRMYQLRFKEPLDDVLTLQQIRGREGIRVRESYAQASRETGVHWEGRNYQRQSWAKADTVNRALSCANSCLYGVCHAAIVSAGYSPALGFIHTGKMLSFVYDIADLYKTTTTIPVAFQAAAEGDTNLERRVRYACRDAFQAHKVLQRIVPDIDEALKVEGDLGEIADFDFDEALPGGLWDPSSGTVAGGVNHADGGGEGDLSGSDYAGEGAGEPPW